MLQHYWGLTIRLFNVLSRTLVGVGSYPSAEIKSVYFTAPANWVSRLTDFNGMSNHLGLSSAYKLRNHIHYTSMFTFFVEFLESFFEQSYISSKVGNHGQGQLEGFLFHNYYTTLRRRRGHYSFPWIAPLYPWSVPYNNVLSKEASSTTFWVFAMTRPGIEPWSSRLSAKTLTQLFGFKYS